MRRCGGGEALPCEGLGGGKSRVETSLSMSKIAQDRWEFKTRPSPLVNGTDL